MSLSEGQVLDGKYVIRRRIAEGGTSTVYLGVNRRIGKDVAVKVLHPAVARDPDILERFEREARIVSRIRSPHVADVYDFGELETGERFMVMEYLEGESLATRLEREHTLPARSLATIASQILDALAAAHASGVIHRDLKPENVIVTTRGKDGRDTIVKVVDFGISKVVDALDADRIKITAEGSVLGTPLYMSPEQARGNTDLVDQRTDLYSLGVMMYEATAGEPPLTGENVNDLLFRVALDEPQPLTTKVPSVDPALAAIVKKAMAKNLAERYRSAEEMREAVEAWKAIFASGTSPAVPSSIGESSVVDPNVALTVIVVPAPTIATPMSLTIPSEATRELANSRDDGLAKAGVFSSFKRARRMAIVVPLFGLLLLGAPAARRTFMQGQAARVTTRANEVTREPEPLAPLQVATPQSASLGAAPPAEEARLPEPIRASAIATRLSPPPRARRPSGGPMPAKSEAPMSEKRVELKVVAYDAGALAIISPDEPRTATTSAPPIEVPPDPAAPGLPE